MLVAPKEIQKNFEHALAGGSFNWSLAATKYFIGNSTIFITNIGGRELCIESRDQLDGTTKWVVKMEHQVLGKDGEYHYEPMPSSRTDDFIENTRFDGPERALEALIKFERNGFKTDLYITPENRNRKGLITLNAELICMFTSFDNWVNKAASKIGGFKKTEKIICLDKNGNACNTGAEFQYARTHDLFPVTAYRLVKSGEEKNEQTA